MSEVNAPTEEVSVTPPDLETPPVRSHRGPVIGGLHLRSAPGACLLFAGVLLIVGIGVAVGGYWNSQPRRQTIHHVSTGRTSSEKLKLIGPVIMGVGLFIFICANTILYENRDRERRKRGQRKDDQEILLVQTHRNNSKRFSRTETNTSTHTLDLSELNIHCLEDGAGIATLKCSLSSSGSCSSSQVNLESGSLFRDCRNMERLALPVIKVNDCLIASSDPVPPPLPERTYRNKMGVENVTNVELTQVNLADSSLMTLNKEEPKDLLCSLRSA
ncbi:transmembrane protein 200A-like [Labeo rohita]|uniref:Transmembrane protein 200A-like n=1 Tax=Labeo rohita TaxID=84645 RepID=A0A498N8B2_LABRO|nr:transmembrane protein 200A [Labeo rohita]XP_050986695.1 transmembrane protein 200A [Labeo rohita]XP_050986696.1 transmembrane protein 200A [Labeo rohita]RXN30418.1 transmembrane protein 200A-like [Labeo rohita]